DSLSGEDAQMNQTYEMLAPFYDFFERLTWKIFIGSNIVGDRKDVVSQIGFEPEIKLLEVSPGSGVFQNALREKVGSKGEIVSLDLSMNMLRQCQKKNSELNINLMHGNAQHLPFADNSFDGLFHFGGVNLFNDPNQAIREFIRVVKKDGLVSWGDERFSSDYPNDFRKSLLSKLNPGFLKPMPETPESVYDVQMQEVYKGHAYLITARKK
ncbi:MAG TPA: methyltransferase domain-containing protein, partial [Thermoflexales bacterium]|nr:methyltransferase domain-containing protein [Thermoflexales bacterium]